MITTGFEAPDSLESGRSVALPLPFTIVRHSFMAASGAGRNRRSDADTETTGSVRTFITPPPRRDHACQFLDSELPTLNMNRLGASPAAARTNQPAGRSIPCPNRPRNGSGTPTTPATLNCVLIFVGVKRQPVLLLAVEPVQAPGLPSTASTPYSARWWPSTPHPSRPTA